MSEDTKDVESVPNLASQWQKVIQRRYFLHGLGLAGAATALPSSNLFADDGNNTLNNNGNNDRGKRPISKGDAALLRFAAAAETIEADLWQQYNELGGAVDHNDKPNPGNPAYVAAL
jgi:hypothetical protein